jgi:hypoxanthine-guanine phosphoribosyltransferase
LNILLFLITIKFTDYEKDQEDKAIISYDELLNKGNNYELNYEKEEMHDDLSVKKVDLDNLVNKNNNTVSNIEVRLISFQKEEAFLEALKRLQKELG